MLGRLDGRGSEWAERRWPTIELFIGGLLALLFVRPHLQGLLYGPALGAWTTVFLAVVLQALPFLRLGVLLSATHRGLRACGLACPSPPATAGGRGPGGGVCWNRVAWM
jgi:hypothetical protein